MVKTLISILLAVTLQAQVDSTMLMIGDQTRLHLEVNADESDKVQFPLYSEYIVPDLLIAEQTKVDTVREKGGRMRMSQDLMLTSFKDSLFYVQPLPFVVNGDTQYTAEGFSLNVIQPFDLDSVNAYDGIMDIKDIERAPIYWAAIWWSLAAFVLLALLAVGGYYLYLYLAKRYRKDETEEVNPDLLRPCEEVAMEKLEKIREEKVWQEGRTKDYFTELTDVLREYIARRYDVQSQEKTSDETLEAVRPILKAADLQDTYTQLQKTLRLADLVKFAKWQTTPDENEIALRQAFHFVEDTKPAVSEGEEKVE